MWIFVGKNETTSTFRFFTVVLCSLYFDPGRTRMVNKRRSRSLEFGESLSFCLSVSRMRSNFSNSKEEKKTSYHNTYTRALCYLSGGSFRGVPKRIPTYIIAGGRVIKLGFEKKRKHGKNRRLHDARVHRGVHIPRLAGGVLSHGCVVVVVVVFVFVFLWSSS